MIRPSTTKLELSDKQQAVTCGGLAAIMELIKAVNLRKHLNDTASVFKLHLPYDEADHIFNIALNLLLDLGEEATPEVISALEEAIREAKQIVDDAEEEKKKRRRKRPRKDDRKFPEHLPRVERIVDLPKDQRESLKLIGYDEVESLQWIRPELRVLPPAVLPPARSIRWQRMDAQSQHAAEHRSGGGVRAASASRIPAKLFETRSNDRLR